MRINASLRFQARQDPANLDSSTESVDLIALIHDIVIQHQPLAQAKQIDLGISRAPEQATLQCNSDSLRIMLANLVSNALRYTPEGGKVDIFISQDPHFQISICDSGPGIPDEEKTRVFDRFYRRSGNAESGSGLGLAIVKSIADRIRATITLKDNPGGGLCANIEFLHKN
ncbi:MAG: ATP-binding protein [Gammaproteobacteria bacterium]